MINARSESAATKPAFRDALKYRRCLIPADGFYEWVRAGKTKQPYCFEVNDGKLFAFAGLWERWKDPSGNWIKTCAILTTTPNAVTAAVHDRMPVILHPDNYDLWRAYPLPAGSIKFRMMMRSAQGLLFCISYHRSACSCRNHSVMG
jgi:putative SOS response-associated peptidase YedK